MLAQVVAAEAAAEPGAVAAEANDPDRGLLGDEIVDLVRRRCGVKLYPTIDDRARFRAQTARLRALGYTFHAKVQTWRPAQTTTEPLPA